MLVQFAIIIVGQVILLVNWSFIAKFEEHMNEENV